MGLTDQSSHAASITLEDPEIPMAVCIASILFSCLLVRASVGVRKHTGETLEDRAERKMRALDTAGALNPQFIKPKKKEEEEHIGLDQKPDGATKNLFDLVQEAVRKILPHDGHGEKISDSPDSDESEATCSNHNQDEDNDNDGKPKPEL